MYIAFFTIILSILHLFASTTNQPKKTLLLITIPKSGTHLIGKCLELFQENLNDFPYNITTMHPGFYAKYAPNPILKRRLWASNPHFKKILNIRDLRDCYCSAVPYLDKLNGFATASHYSKIWAKLKTPTQKLTYLLQLTHQLPWDLTLTFKEMANIMPEPNVFVNHFEDLVGLMGGGDKDTQIN